jgi:hypothetical protein
MKLFRSMKFKLQSFDSYVIAFKSKGTHYVFKLLPNIDHVI